MIVNPSTNYYDLELTAAKDLSTPVSYIGSAHMFMPMARGSTGWLSFLRYTGVIILLGLFWLVVTTPFYLLVFALVPTILPTLLWLVFTNSRRRSIRNARNTLALRAPQPVPAFATTAMPLCQRCGRPGQEHTMDGGCPDLPGQHAITE